LPFSKLGAAARESPRGAAQAWRVPLERVTAVQGVLGNLDRPNERAHYGEFAQLRGSWIDADPPLKAAHERRLLGRTPQRRDTPAKVDGSATFAIDVRLPAMQVAGVRALSAFRWSVRALRCCGSAIECGV
jgi:isoquinoline 1-oxidoreductase beta subunit